MSTKKRLIITDQMAIKLTQINAGLTEEELLSTSRSINEDGMLWRLADADSYLPDDVPTNSNGRKLWRSQELPIIPSRWQRVPRHDYEQHLADAIAAVQGAGEIIHAGEANRYGQHAVDQLLIAAGRDPRGVVRCPMPGPAAGRNDEERACAALDALSDQRRNHGEAMNAAATAVEKVDWLLDVNITRAVSVARGRPLRVPRWSLPLAAYVISAGPGRVLEADAIAEIGCSGGSLDVSCAVMHGFVERKNRRGAPWETHAPTTWRNLSARFYDLVPTDRARQLIEWLGGPAHPLCRPPRDSEVLGAIEAGVLRAEDWLREEEDFVREQVAQLLQSDSAAAAQH